MAGRTETFQRRRVALIGTAALLLIVQLACGETQTPAPAAPTKQIQSPTFWIPSQTNTPPQQIISPTYTPTLQITSPTPTDTPTPTPLPDTGAIQGKVRGANYPNYQDDDLQVEMLDMPGKFAKIEKDGSFILENVPYGPHFIYARGRYMLSGVVYAPVSSKVQTVDILFPRPATPPPEPIPKFIGEGRVAYENGQPVNGATVWVLGGYDSMITGSDGIFPVEVPGGSSKVYLAVAGDLWGFAEFKDKSKALVLDRRSPSPDPPKVIYDLIAEAGKAQWRNGHAQDVWNRSDNDPLGFALWRDHFVLQDGSQPGRVLETHPEWVDYGTILGLYPQTVIPTTKDFFYAEVGFLRGAGAGKVKFSVIFISQGEDKGAYKIAEVEMAYNSDPSLSILSLPFPQDTINRRGLIRLQVDAGETAAWDWAVWVVAQVRRRG